MMLIFPFEEEIYRTEGIPASYIGHPLLERVRAGFGRAELFAKYGLDPAKKLVVLLPGSRRGELRFHAPVLAETVARLRTSADLQFALVLAESLGRSDLNRAWPGPIEGLTVLERDGYEAMAAADVVLSSCGTATLEAALLGAPVIAFYRISPLTYRGRAALRQDQPVQHRQHPGREAGRSRAHPGGFHGREPGPRSPPRPGLRGRPPEDAGRVPRDPEEPGRGPGLGERGARAGEVPGSEARRRRIAA